MTNHYFELSLSAITHSVNAYYTSRLIQWNSVDSLSEIKLRLCLLAVCFIWDTTLILVAHPLPQQRLRQGWHSERQRRRRLPVASKNSPSTRFKKHMAASNESQSPFSNISHKGDETSKRIPKFPRKTKRLVK